MRKNSLRKFLMVSFLSLIIGMTVLSCHQNSDDSDAGFDASQTEQTDGKDAGAEKKDSTSTKKNGAGVSDSIMAPSNRALRDSIEALKAKVDSLNGRIETLTQQISDLENGKAEKKDLHSLDSYLWIAALLALVSLLVAIFSVMGCRKIGRDLGEEIAELRRAKRIGDSGPKRNVSVAPGSRGVGLNPDTMDINIKLRSLEDRVKSLEKGSLKVQTGGAANVKNGSSRNVHTHDAAPQKGASTGYFGNPSRGADGGYFKGVMGHRDSEARFKAEIEGDNASFVPITDTEAARRTLISSDYAKMAIDFTGCAPSEMSSMRVVEKGKGRQVSGRWIIIKKAVVELSK